MDYFRAARELPAATRARATRTDESPSLLSPTRTQWVSTGLAIALLWGFVIAALADPVEMSAELGSWKTWVSRNTGWLFIAAFVRAPPESRTPGFPRSANRHSVASVFQTEKTGARGKILFRKGRLTHRSVLSILLLTKQTREKKKTSKTKTERVGRVPPVRGLL